MNLLDGKNLAILIKNQVRENTLSCFPSFRPMLECIIVEGNSASETYVKSKQKACEYCGLLSHVTRLKENVSQKELEDKISALNNDSSVTAILLQLPLPKHLDSVSAINKISPSKDVDCLTNFNLGRLFSGSSSFAPCTASGIVKLLEHYNIPIQGRHVVVVGRSLLVGKSVACLFEQKNATVTICHSKTVNLSSFTSQADILVVAVGKPNFISKNFVKPGAVVVDVGINRINGKLCGDVYFDEVKDVCSFISPVPGGVGPLTVACLMENTFKLAFKNFANNNL